MLYSLLAIFALLVLLIMNEEILFKRKGVGNIPAFKQLRFFLFAIVAYYITDVLWGFLDELPDKMPAYIDTAFYFLAMALSVFAWTQFVVAYIPQNKAFRITLTIIGAVILAGGVAIIITNFFEPILFDYNENGYHGATARYSFFTAQMAMFILASIYATVVAFKQKGTMRRRHITIALFGFIMVIAILGQLFFPLAPMYAGGLLVGTVVIHIFVVVDEKNDYRKRIQNSEKELVVAKEMAFTDALTGVKSKHAYVEMEQEIDRLIAKGEIHEFAVVVFDLNDLKGVNDRRGHEMGDKMLIACCDLIREFFPDSSIYRYGGDEFVVFLENGAFADRHQRMDAFDHQVEKNLVSDGVVVSTGLSDFRPGEDNAIRAVFSRADLDMYSHKKILKAMQATHKRLSTGKPS